MLLYKIKHIEYKKDCVLTYIGLKIKKFSPYVETFFVLWLIKSKNEVKPVWIAASGERYFDTMK